MTVLIKRNILIKEKFNSKYNVIGDFDFFLRISLKKKIGCIQKPLAYYRIHGENFSKKYIRLYTKELDYWIEKNQKLYERLGFSLSHLKFYLIKLKVKYFLNLIGRIVQW